MTTVVLRASDLILAQGTVTEVGGTVETKLNDGLDTTYLRMDRDSAFDSRAKMSLDTFTLGTGRMKSWFVSWRRAWEGGAQPPVQVSLTSDTVVPGIGVLDQARDYPPATAFTTTTSAPQVPPNLTQAQINDLCVLFAIEAGTPGQVYMPEMFVSVTYAVAPTANITYPTGSPTLTATSTPTATWTHSGGSDGGSQAAYQLKAFTAAQYGAGGFSPDTSTAAFDPGVVTRSANSAPVGPLANSTTFKIYLRTAQSINGALHWSPWDNETVSTNFTPATVSSVTTSATSASGYITVTVNHSGAAWVDVEVERSDDGGTTYVPVRGATKVTATNTFVTAWSSSAVVVRDYEAPNATSVLYRARASTALVTGAYTAASSTSWSSSAVWLKDPLNPALNVALLVTEQPQPTRSVTQGVFDIIGGSYPVVVSDVRKARHGTFVTSTRLTADSALFDAAVESTFKLLQFPASHLWGSKYIALADVQEMYVIPNADRPNRLWQVGYVEVARPADDTNY